MLYDALTSRLHFAPDYVWTALFVAWIIGSTLFLLLRRRRPATTLAWIFAFWALPIVSGLVYFLFGPRRLDSQSGLRQRARRLSATVAPRPAEALPEEFLAATTFADVARVSRALGDVDPEPRRASSFAIYRDGEEAYPEIERAFREARKTINLQYYIWQPDKIGTHFRDLLAQRARDGIEVRLVVDTLGAKNCAGDFWNPMIDAGAEVRKFNPPHPLKPQPGKTNFRTHKKIAVIDGTIAFTGGINVNDEDTAHGGRPWRDTHVRLEGAPSLDLQTIFLDDWLYGLPVKASARRPKGPGELAGEGGGPSLPEGVEDWFPEFEEGQGPWVQVVDSGPDESSHDIHMLMFTAITLARKRVWITTPYFVPDDSILTALTCAASRGVDVRLLLPAEGDSKVVEAAAETFTREIAERGARVWRYDPVMNHSKTMVVDDGLALVGTANMDNRSFRLNFELMLAIFDEGVTADLAALFEQDLEQSHRFEARDPGVRQRLIENAARILAPFL
ncbi:Major cardiolipin synthase ClsA [Planctomycetes bacterium Poly30]|uniref:Major cardiolipin synthase ClsA n=1 Tax=Saltatorellus ferox TaxID=2528018 RepID=A0A518EYP9_9BACT|nr:Major cardiolipin synthase ClsA [Planctomycetes bacterium Poly30]